MEDRKLIERITINPQIFGGKPIIRGKRLAVEHVLGMLAAGDTPELILKGYDWLEPEDIKGVLAVEAGVFLALAASDMRSTPGEGGERYCTGIRAGSDALSCCCLDVGKRRAGC